MATSVEPQTLWSTLMILWRCNITRSTGPASESELVDAFSDLELSSSSELELDDALGLEDEDEVFFFFIFLAFFPFPFLPFLCPFDFRFLRSSPSSSSPFSAASKSVVAVSSTTSSSPSLSQIRYCRVSWPTSRSAEHEADGCGNWQLHWTQFGGIIVSIYYINKA